jgi:3-deoxy-manno-octulosonate cytidylyltransferase (CMP-KDO synthetase)
MLTDAGDADVVAVIPARFGSTRLGGKPLADIGGVPMVVRVWRNARRARLLNRVIVATDDPRILEAVRVAGGEAMMTSPAHPSGTDRVAEVAALVAAPIYLNVQGDLPFIEPADLDSLARAMSADPGLEMATLATPISNESQWRDPNAVKVVCDSRGRALYFSRSPIPFARDGGLPKTALRHIGVYAYRRDFLFRFATLEPSPLEQVEKLEQLRALENGWRIGVIPTAVPSLEVDCEVDLARARELAAQNDPSGEQSGSE